ncbi:MAG: translation initiation factor IF-1 [Verrucomicrobiota bacterium]
MPRDDAIKVEGTVTEVLPNNMFWVTLANRHRVMAHVSSKMRLHFVKIATGDKVNLEMSPYDLSKGCIVLRENSL